MICVYPVSVNFHLLRSEKWIFRNIKAISRVTAPDPWLDWLHASSRPGQEWHWKNRSHFLAHIFSLNLLFFPPSVTPWRLPLVGDALGQKCWELQTETMLLALLCSQASGWESEGDRKLLGPVFHLARSTQRAPEEWYLGSNITAFIISEQNTQ